MKDIEMLNNKNDRFIEEIKKIQAERATYNSKIVSLENDNDHYINKIREMMQKLKI